MYSLTAEYHMTSFRPWLVLGLLCGLSIGCANIEEDEVVTIADGHVTECVDVDGDGFAACGDDARIVDCDDSDLDVHPGATDICNGIDDDCDGNIDEYITGCETADPPGEPAAEVPEGFK